MTLEDNRSSTDTNDNYEEFESEDTLHLTQEGIDLVQRRDVDGGVTTLREAAEKYNAGDFVGGDSLVLLVAMFGMIFGNQELVDAAKKTKRFAASDN